MGSKLPDTKRHYVEDNLQLVHYCVHKYIKPLADDYEDVYQEGCIGLIKAAIGYDENYGTKFSTYAVPMILGYCKRYLREKKPLVKYSRSMIDLYAKICALKADGLTDEEAIQELNVGSSLYFEVISINTVASLDDVMYEGKDGSVLTIMDSVGDYYLDKDFNSIDTQETLEAALEKVVAKIGDKYRDIYEEYMYCLFYGEKLSQEYFAEKYKISQAQVSRILKKLNKVYRTLLQGEEL